MKHNTMQNNVTTTKTKEGFRQRRLGSKEKVCEVIHKDSSLENRRS